jgi:hypothetical protein
MENRTSEEIETTGPPVFGNADGRKGYDEQVDAAREAQTVPCAVAPSCSLIATDTGQVLQAGQPVSPVNTFGRKDFLSALARPGGVLIELSDEEMILRREYSDCTHLMAGKSVISRVGIKPPGQPCKASHWATAAVPAYQSADPVTGVVRNVPAVVANDGSATFENLIALGYIVKNPDYRKRSKRAKR